MDEEAEDFGKRINLALEPLGGPALPVEPGSEALVEFAARLALQPGGECIGEDGCLRRAGRSGQRLELFRQSVGQVELMAGLERLHARRSFRLVGSRLRPPMDRVSLVPLGDVQGRFVQLMPSPRARVPMVQLMPSPRMTPDTDLPTARSSTGRQGTRLNSRLFSISA